MNVVIFTTFGLVAKEFRELGFQASFFRRGKEGIDGNTKETEARDEDAVELFRVRLPDKIGEREGVEKMDKGTAGKGEGLKPVGNGESLFEREKVARAAAEENVSGERLNVFEFVERHGDTGEPDRETATEGTGRLCDGSVGKFGVVAEVEF